jgi:NAD(P)-dependent dehydrogenase (short-subunit alcohol dehydrogenase family)
MSFADLHDQVALVTGGGAGIGAATARRLALLVADVAVFDRDLGAARAATAELQALGRRALPIEIDLRNVDEIAAAADQVLAKLGRIDILVQCAYLHGWGAGIPEKVLEIRGDDWDLIYTVNVKAPLLLLQHVARHMTARGEGGRIVNVTSTSAQKLLGHVGEPEDVAAAIAFHCLPDARHITAKTIFASAGAAL